ncbi:hypothetical protein QBC35DRAFT_476103 [Podospora australis]|uniref:Uncharacterized protein n=1 Tax=Podospora australis TaxID=1536484 RepID=A0AAN6WQP3_9PEZI|nr:hypothetical protein QBC35DRAFT_476103 [Podospora australis]
MTLSDVDSSADILDHPSKATSIDGENTCLQIFEPVRVQQPVNTRRSVGDTIELWIWELASSGIALGVLAGIVVTLATSSGKEIPKWPLSLNLGSLIAMYTTLLRALLFYTLSEVIGQEKWAWINHSHKLRHLDTFDVASRGALGSLRLISVCYSTFVPTLAAWSMILLFAIGPFAQQSVQTSVCSILHHTQLAKVPVAYKIPPNEVPAWSTPGQKLELNPLTFSALLSGLSDLDNVSKSSGLDLQCPTGNCTFREFDGMTYSTLGICSKCEDITHLIQEIHECPMGGVDCHYEYKLNYPFGSPVSIALKEGGNILHVNSSISHPFNVFINTTILLRAGEDCGNSSCSQPSQLENLRGLSYDTRLIGASCSLFGCVKRFHGAVVNGELTENLLSTSTLQPNLAPEDNHTLVAVPNPCIADNTMVDLSRTPRPSTFHNQWKRPISLAGNPVQELPQQCVFGLQAQWMEMLRASVQKVLSGTCGAWEQGRRYRDGSLLPMDCRELPWLQCFSKNNRATFGTVSSRFDNIASSLTNRIRSIGLDWFVIWDDGSSPGRVYFESVGLESNRAYAYGTAHTESICVRFDWQWMVLPGTVTLLTCFLLTISVLRTYRDGNKKPVWKSSVLPLLFHGIREAGTSWQPPDRWMSVEEMQQRADSVRACYVKDLKNGQDGYGIKVEQIAENTEIRVRKTHGPSAE